MILPLVSASSTLKCQTGKIVIHWALPLDQRTHWYQACIELCEPSGINLGECNCGEGSAITGDLTLTSAVSSTNLARLWDSRTGYTKSYDDYASSIFYAVGYVGNPLVTQCSAVKETLAIEDDGKVTDGVLDFNGKISIGTLLDYKNLKEEDAELWGIMEFNGDNRILKLPNGKLFVLSDNDEHFEGDLNIENDASTITYIEYKIGGVKNGYLDVTPANDVFASIGKFFAGIWQKIKPTKPVLTITGLEREESFMCKYTYPENSIEKITSGSIALYKIKDSSVYSRALHGSFEASTSSLNNQISFAYYDLLREKVIGYSVKDPDSENIALVELFDQENRLSISGLANLPEDSEIISKEIKELRATRGEASYGNTRMCINCDLPS